MEKPFSYLIYQQGKRIYQQNRFGEIRVNHNEVKGYVHDPKPYEVKLIFNPKRHLTGKRCTCDYALQYHECKHMAALYMKVIQENYLDTSVQKLRYFYDVYIASRVRPLIKNYSDFEYKIRTQLEMFYRNQMFDSIKDYALEFSIINYPTTRISFIVEMFQDVIESMLLNENYVEEIENWMYSSLLNNKNIFLHDYFLNYIQRKQPNEICDICDKLLESKGIIDNNLLSSKILLLSFKNSSISLSDFLEKHTSYNHSEAMYLLKGENYLRNKEYPKAIALAQEYFRTVKQPSLFEEMRKIMKRANIGHDPMRYIRSFVNELNYWETDLSGLTEIKEILADEWQDFCVDVYALLAKKVDNYTFVRVIHEQNDWEYALHLIYEKPTFNHLFNYVDLIEKNAPEMVDSVVFECLMNNASTSSSFGAYQLLIDRIEKLVRGIESSSVRNYVFYYLKKLNHDKVKLIEMLDQLEDEYED